MFHNTQLPLFFTFQNSFRVIQTDSLFSIFIFYIALIFLSAKLSLHLINRFSSQGESWKMLENKFHLMCRIPGYSVVLFHVKLFSTIFSICTFIYMCLLGTEFTTHSASLGYYSNVHRDIFFLYVVMEKGTIQIFKLI